MNGFKTRMPVRLQKKENNAKFSTNIRVYQLHIYYQVSIQCVYVWGFTNPTVLKSRFDLFS
jgi:hypothetical protein